MANGTKRTTLAILGVGAVAVLGALMLFPKKAGAAPLTDETPEPREGPKNAQEAYGLAMNTSMKDSAYVLELAQYLKSEGSHPEWAGAAQKRYYDLKAEELLGEGLKLSTDLGRVDAIAKTLQQTHNDYAVVLGMRQMVQTGQKAPPPSFNLPLMSGGSLVVDMGIYSPSAPNVVRPGSPSPAPSFSPSAPSLPPAAGGSGAVAVPQQAPAAAPVIVPPNAPPLAVEETKPENDPYGTIRLARMLLDEQSRKGWKYVSQSVKDWQSRVGLTDDGKFGPGSALRMAQEVAIMPWIRYWPLGSPSKTAAVEGYRSRLKAYALGIERQKPEHAKALFIAANTENGQGWPTAPAASPGSEPNEKQVQAVILEMSRMRKS
jgi:hypothetical protein